MAVVAAGPLQFLLLEALLVMHLDLFLQKQHHEGLSRSPFLSLSGFQWLFSPHLVSNYFVFS